MSEKINYLPAIERVAPEGATVSAAVIWLHGLGADGNDFAPIVPQLGLPAETGIRFIFPHAPSMPVTINNGFNMPAWYDIKALDLDRHIDESQLLHSARRIQDLIDREIDRGVDSRHILLAGFSQGGAVAYQAGLTYPQPLAGIIAMSSYLATADRISVHEAQAGLPILVCHGEQDPVVPEALGRQSVGALLNLGLEAEYRTYPMDHAVCPAEIMDLGAFMRQHLT